MEASCPAWVVHEFFFSHSCFSHCLYKQPIEQMPTDKIFICFQWLESHNTNFILVQFSAKNNITFTLFTCFRIMKYLNSSKLLLIWFKLEKSFSFHLRNCHTTYKMGTYIAGMCDKISRKFNLLSILNFVMLIWRSNSLRIWLNLSRIPWSVLNSSRVLILFLH